MRKPLGQLGGAIQRPLLRISTIFFMVLLAYFSAQSAAGQTQVPWALDQVVTNTGNGNPITAPALTPSQANEEAFLLVNGDGGLGEYCPSDSDVPCPPPCGVGSYASYLTGISPPWTTTPYTVSPGGVLVLVSSGILPWGPLEGDGFPNQKDIEPFTYWNSTTAAIGATASGVWPSCLPSDWGTVLALVSYQGSAPLNGPVVVGSFGGYFAGPQSISGLVNGGSPSFLIGYIQWFGDDLSQDITISDPAGNNYQVIADVQTSSGCTPQFDQYGFWIPGCESPGTRMQMFISPNYSNPSGIVNISAVSLYSIEAVALGALCPTPTLASVTPDIWHAGQILYNVTFAGTGFVTSANATTLCPMTQLTVDAPSGYGSITVSNVNVASDTQITATIQPAATDPTEPVGITVWNKSGVYGSAQIIGDCALPTITSVSPSTWFAGKSYKTTITGTGFITSANATAACPVTPVNITAADGSVVPVSDVNVASPTKITVTVAPQANDSTETATVTVTISPYSTPASAQILGNQIRCDPSMNCTQDVISTTDGSDPPVQNVVVGQPIALTTNPDLPTTINPVSTTWTVDGTKIAGYNPTTGPTDVTPIKAADLKKSNITYYWVYPNGSIPVTYQYCVNIPGAQPVKQCSLVANATFNVTGPGDAQMTVDAYDQLNIDMLIDKNACFPILDDEDPYLEYGNISGYESPCGVTTNNPPGMTFTPPPSSSGTYSFAQVITEDTTEYTQGKHGTLSCPTKPGLDGVYPYPMGPPDYDKTWDHPAIKLELIDSKVSRNFKAAMYLLWTSSKAGSIPVPIGSQSWIIAQGGAKNQGYPISQNWAQPIWNLLGTDGDPVDYVKTTPSQSPYGYPTWNGLATPVLKLNCPTDTTEKDEAQQEEVLQ